MAISPLFRPKSTLGEVKLSKNETYEINEEPFYEVKKGKPKGSEVSKIRNERLYNTIRVLRVGEYFDLPYATKSHEGCRGTVFHVVNTLKKANEIPDTYKITTSLKSKYVRIWRIQ